MTDRRARIAGVVGLLLGAGMIALAIPLAWRDGSRGPVRGGERIIAAIDASGTVTPAAETQVRELLKTQPGYGAAYRVLAQAALQKHDMARADALLDAAVKLDPREITTRALLIDRAYARQDAQALATNADALLRVAPETAPALLPQLAFVMQSADVRSAFVDRLMPDTPWRNALASALAEGSSNESALAFFKAAAAKTALTEAEHSAQLKVLLAKGQGSEARAAWVAALPAAQQIFARKLLFDGGFEAGETSPPFGWSLGNAPSVLIATDPNHVEGQTSLALSFDGREVQGIRVVQNLVLTPGRYVFHGQVQNQTAASRPFRWTFSCTGAISRPIGEVDLPMGQSGNWQKFETIVTVASECPTQALALIYPARSKSERLVTGTLYIDDLDIESVR